MPVYRVDFHHHAQGDPADTLFYSVKDLVDESIKKGLHAIAITMHGKVWYDPDLIQYAKNKGLILIPGVEKRVEKKEVLILNVQPEEIPTPMTFDDLRSLRLKRGPEILVIAPHPFYPSTACMGSLLNQHKDLFDGIEFAHLHLEFFNPNAEAVDWARKNNKAILANSDTHSLFMVGRNFTEVTAQEWSVDCIFEAIRNRNTRAIAHVPHIVEVARFVIEVTLFQYLLRLILPTRRKIVFQNKIGQV